MGSNTIKLKPLMSEKESDKFEGMLLTQDHCKKLFTSDVDLYDAESGKCIAKFRKGVIPPELYTAAYTELLGAAKTSLNRGVAGGKSEGKSTFKPIRKDGKQSKQSQAKEPVDSGIIGYFDRTTRIPTCRLTAFNQKHMDKFKRAYPIIKFVDSMYAKLMPRYYSAQMDLANRTAQDFVIRGTSFTTVTVNKNYRTAVHKDSGDFQGGFGNLVAIRQGTFDGCHLVLPRWGAGFDLQNGDLLLMDVHQWHGNTPMIKIDPTAVRLSLVMYYRENMIKCGSAKEELKRVQTRKKGDKLN